MTESEAVMSSGSTGGIKQRKYSTALLEEGYRLSRQIGAAKASRLLEINHFVLKRYICTKYRLAGIPPRTSRVKKKQCSYDTERQVCGLAIRIIKASSIYGDPGITAKHWKSAGGRYGVDGLRIKDRYHRGLVVI